MTAPDSPPHPVDDNRCMPERSFPDASTHIPSSKPLVAETPALPHGTAGASRLCSAAASGFAQGSHVNETLTSCLPATVAMVEPTPRETAPAAPSTDPRTAVAAGNTHTSKTQAAGKAGAEEPSRAPASTIDELLAKEALANLKRSRATTRSEPVKFRARTPIPAATLVVKPSQRPPWLTPFIALAAVVMITSISSAGGMAYLFMRPVTTAATSDTELRNLRETVAQLRRTIATLSGDMAANRAALDVANKAVSDRFGRLTQSVERVERDQSVSATRIERIAEEKAQVARTGAAAPSPEITGSVQPQRPSSTRRDIVAGWRVRRAFDGVAVLEGPLGVIEVMRGQEITNLGRIEEIKHDNGNWQVLTSKGTILSTR